MTGHASFTIFPLRSLLLVTIAEEIADSEVTHLLDQLCQQVQRGRVRGVIVDMRRVEVVDSYMAHHLETMAAALRLLDATMVVAGLSVPVVMTLVDFGIELVGLAFARDVEMAADMLEAGGYEEISLPF
ncbi:MAG: STAS domain-containing protein [Thermodesulfobacteriota bacterium]